jgi:hypothetical protein
MRNTLEWLTDMDVDLRFTQVFAHSYNFDLAWNLIHSSVFWLRASCRSNLTASLKAEKLMVFSSKADCFVATLSSLLSLDEEGRGF